MSNKKSLFLAFVFASMLTAPMANAAAGGMTFGLNAGVAMPMGDFGDFAKLGFGGGVYGDYWVSNAFGIGADIMYNRFSGDEDVTGPDVSFTDIQFGGHLKYAFPMEGSSFAPWLQAGFAAYNGKVDGVTGGDDSSTDMGFNVGAGLGFWSSPTMSMGVLGLFHNVMTDPDSQQYINVGLNLTFSTTGTSTMGAQP